MSDEHFVVIGNGPAGNQAALTLREKAPGVRVTLISKDPESCYRPHVLPRLIAGRVPEEVLYVCTRESYGARDIKLRSGQAVVGLNPAGRELTLDHKEILPFTGLIIAVGGRPRIPEGLLGLREHLFELKTLRQARTWAACLPGVESVLVIGGDLTSFAVTKSLLRLGKKVYFMLNEEAFWPLRPDRTVFEEAARKLTNMGVEVLKRRRVQGVKRLSERAFEVDMDGQRITVGLVGAFFGLVPDIGFLAGSGLQCDRGILVDEYLHTGFEGIYATGDCAQIYHRELRDYWVSIGYDNAIALGRVAALNLLGGHVSADVPAESIYDVEGVRVNTSWWMEF
ncbi:MAG: NAD(P)/FAD-dependent oxidoreductase [Pseudomonadota bacterium]